MPHKLNRLFVVGGVLSTLRIALIRITSGAFCRPRCDYRGVRRARKHDALTTPLNGVNSARAGARRPAPGTDHLKIRKSSSLWEMNSALARKMITARSRTAIQPGTQPRGASRGWDPPQNPPIFPTFFTSAGYLFVFAVTLRCPRNSRRSGSELLSPKQV